MDKNMNKSLFFCVIFLQICFVLSIPAIKEANLRGAKSIVVKTIPVDPQSLFRGDYINLGYEFSQIDLKKAENERDFFNRGERVFVKLSKSSGAWQAVKISSNPIKEVAPEEVVVRGSIDNWPRQNKINVVYGIESYFVPEGKGKYIEKNIAQKRATVELSIDKKGFTCVRKIFIDDKEVKFR